MSAAREKYLAAALNVVKGVKSKVPFGASNRGSDYDAAYEKFHKKIEGGNPNALDKLLGEMTRFLPLLTGANRAQQIYAEKTGDIPDGDSFADKLNRMRQIANITVKTKAGNCNEQSIVAFVDLYDLGIRPLAWVYTGNERHAFVLIGRASGTGPNPANWGDDCVVCDPWANEAYCLPAETGAGILQAKWGSPIVKPQFGVA
ncbi:MAG TPA: hypothetical protein VIL74_00880 [Pyrinomonadaceae bacterium]|jgi:hypothetical protein